MRNILPIPRFLWMLFDHFHSNIWVTRYQPQSQGFSGCFSIMSIVRFGLRDILAQCQSFLDTFRVNTLEYSFYKLLEKVLPKEYGLERNKKTNKQSDFFSSDRNAYFLYYNLTYKSS